LPQKQASKQVARFQQSLYGDKQAKAQSITPANRVAKTPFFVTLTRWGGKQLGRKAILRPCKEHHFFA